MYNEEANEVYKKIDTLFKIKGRPMVKGSGLKFERILSAVDLVKGYEFYILIIDGKSRYFKDKKSLLIQLSHHCAEQFKERVEHIRQLEYHRQHDMYFDDVKNVPLLNQLSGEIEKLKHFGEHLRGLMDAL
ncbi:MAG: hypothetical protein JWR38_2963 [Mucilaginibacter sp.]|nr:hypothetical protein [Mucilaginibacter sp.]